MRSLFVVLSSLLALSVPACSTPSEPDGGTDAPATDAPATDAGADVTIEVSTPDVGADAGLDAPSGPDAGSCLLEHTAGDRYPAGDVCNFCVCNGDGSTTCTDRPCPVSTGGCTYAGTAHDYGARFPSTDGCNECVCAASGLACTRRAGCAASDEGAILLESLNDVCGENSEFTPGNVLATLPTTDFIAPFLYERTRTAYPEVLPDTDIRLRIVYDGGFLVCRIPMPTQPALDIQVTVEWITEDGAFDEGFPAYLRRNDFGFVDSWTTVASAPLGGLNGTYTPICSLDPGGYAFAAEVEPNGHATGTINRVCETDIPLIVGTFDRPAP